MIYFLRPTEDTPFAFNRYVTIEDRPIKIGSTVNPPKRLGWLRGQLKRPDLVILGVMPGGIIGEKELHERFDHLRYTYDYWQKGQHVIYKTEWCRPADELLAFIEANTKPFEPSMMDAQGPLMVRDEYLMLIERIAFGQKRSVDSVIEEMLADHFKKDRDAASPYRPDAEMSHWRLSRQRKAQ